MREIILQRIRTPDGTILTSHHRHDYQTHVDKITGEEYMIDGGRTYSRRSRNKVSAEDMTVYRDDPFELVRTAFYWGTRGKDGKQPLVRLPLCTLSDSHIQNIIDTQRYPYISTENLELFKKELEYRKERGITIGETYD